MLFEAAAGCFLVLDPAFVIVAVGDAYLGDTNQTRRCATPFGVFPDNPDDPAASGMSLINAGTDRILNTIGAVKLHNMV